METRRVVISPAELIICPPSYRCDALYRLLVDLARAHTDRLGVDLAAIDALRHKAHAASLLIEVGEEEEEKVKEAAPPPPPFQCPAAVDETQALLAWVNAWLVRLHRVDERPSGGGSLKYASIRRLVAMKLIAHAVELLAHLGAPVADRWLTAELTQIAATAKEPFDAAAIVNPFMGVLVDGFDELLAADRIAAVRAMAGRQSAAGDLTLTAALMRTLREERAKTADMRAVVFVRTRAMARLLAQAVNEQQQQQAKEERAMRAAFLTSVNQSTTAGGQTAEEQARTMEAFRRWVRNYCLRTIDLGGI